MNNLKIGLSHLKISEQVSQIIDSYQCIAISEISKEQKLKASYTITKLQDDIMLEVLIEGAITLECSRCLKAFKFPVSIKTTQLYPKDCLEIDIADEFQQSLILNMPDKPLCKNSCTGLCPHCGKDLNTGNCKCREDYTDPRWEKLKQLIK